MGSSFNKRDFINKIIINNNNVCSYITLVSAFDKMLMALTYITKAGGGS